MDCHSNHSVFLRSTGALACWCDAGSKLTLQRFDPEVDYSRDVVFGPVFGAIRSKLRADQMPFPRQCQDCMVLACGAPFDGGWEERKEISVFQVESSIACILECPGCMTLADRRKTYGRPWHLEVEIFEKYLSDFRNDGVTIRTIDFQGHGEPLLNRDIWTMVRLAKSYFPQTTVSICTAAHGSYAPDQVLSGIDRMLFSIDGIDQASFEPNRVRGNFAKAYGYMKDFCLGARAEGRQIETVWKYILFDCNNRPEQLLRAQEMALEAGVGELHFVNTQLGLKSSRIYGLEDIPRLPGLPEDALKITVSGYLSNFHDVMHSVDKARFALMEGQAGEAVTHLSFAANMIRRRFECVEPGDSLPVDYEVLIHEVLDLCDDPLVGPGPREAIRGGFHLVLGKLTLDMAEAKERIVAWKAEETERLLDRLTRESGQDRMVFARQLAGAGGAPAPDPADRLERGAQQLRRQARDIHRLASLLEQKPWLTPPAPAPDTVAGLGSGLSSDPGAGPGAGLKPGLGSEGTRDVTPAPEAAAPPRGLAHALKRRAGSRVLRVLRKAAGAR